MNRSKSVEDELYIIGLWGIALGGIGIVLYFAVIRDFLPPASCVFLKMFGLYCPGCGGTRAVEALLHGRILESLWYHPVVLYTVIVFGGFMLTNTLRRIPNSPVKGWKFHVWHLYGALVIIFLNWILKNILLIGFDRMM
uniref:DUF2752 domain-containing protein n=1 Tax=Acetatifactor sp. TaxID=1872090 RepID=UPI004056F5A2